VQGPQGAFKPLAGAVKATTGARSLKTFPVEVRDGAIWLVGGELQKEQVLPPATLGVQAAQPSDRAEQREQHLLHRPRGAGHADLLRIGGD
jgi:phenylpropionate dioxygenase-like ring-hydroxylating dioxygenase large terminal subunit